MSICARKYTIRLLVILLFLLLYGVLAAPHASAVTDVWDGTVADGFAGGDGTYYNPYEIATGAQLAYLAEYPNDASDEYFMLTSDIDLNNHAWTPIGTTYTFRGCFNGQNHVIYNLSIGTADAPDTTLDRVGLFGSVGHTIWTQEMSVQNLGLENVSIYTSAASYAGGLAGYVGPGSIIEKCYASGTIAQKVAKDETSYIYYGGLIGMIATDHASTVSNCCSTVTVRNDVDNVRLIYIGGLTARTRGTEFKTCYTASELYLGYSGIVRGLIGYINTAETLTGCHWCREALQYSEGELIPEDERTATAFDDTYYKSVEAETMAYMQTSDFVDELNDEYTSTDTWSIIEGLNGGFPVPFIFTPEIALSPPDDKVFDTRVEGYGEQTAYTVTVNNTGQLATGILSVALSGTNAASFTLSKTSIEAIDAGASDSFTVVPKTRLSAGAHTATVTVSGDDVTAQTFDVSFTVEEPRYAIAANPAAIDFGSAIEGYGSVAAVTVTVTNTGNMSVMLTQPEADSYSIGALSQTTLNPGDTATFTVSPETGLKAGSYDTTITVKGSDGAETSVDADFMVVAAVYAISAEPAETDFGSVFTGYGTVAAKTVTITNAGNLGVTLTQTAAVNYTIGVLSQTALDPGETATFTVCPKDGFPAGTYDETVTVEGTDGVQTSVDAYFAVKDKSYTITVSPAETDFGSVLLGYDPLDARTITVQNTGNQIVSLAQPEAVHYIVGPLSKTALNPDDTAAFTVRPKDGLPDGTYNETIAVRESRGGQSTVDTRFQVVSVEYGMTPKSGAFVISGAAGLTFTANAAFLKFIGVSVDGTMLAENQYSAEEGSTVITLFSDYLSGLSLGPHTLRVLFKDGYADAAIYIDVAPETGDGYPAALYIAIAALALSAFIVLRRKRFSR